jgi:hypothetical protein
MPNLIPPPVPTQQKMLDSNGLATRPWISWFTTLGQIFGYNQTIQADGKAVPQETSLNFVGFQVNDDAANGRTNVSITLPPAYNIQSGVTTLPSTGTNSTTGSVSFPSAFASPPKVFLSPTVFPRSSNEPVSCYPTNITETGFDVNMACAVPTGGGGGVFDNQVPVDWMAIA